MLIAIGTLICVAGITIIVKKYKLIGKDKVEL